MEYQVVIVAAGQGSRMGMDRNKVLLPLHGAPVIVRTLQVFDNDVCCKGIVLVTQGTETELFRSLIEAYGITKDVMFASGGKERQESVYNGLSLLAGEDPDQVVLIHDGARPFIRKDRIAEVVEAAGRFGAALLAVPVKDTIKKVSGGQVVDTLKRESLWSAQTPQAFRLSIILRAHRQGKINHVVATDDASLVEQLSLPVKVVKGSYRNIKLTTPEDMAVAEKFLEEEEKSHADRSRF